MDRRSTNTVAIRLLAMLCCLSLAAPALSQTHSARFDVYVDAQGGDAEGSGEKDRPVRSLSAAQQVIAGRYRDERDIAIHVRPGVYQRSEFRWTWFPETLHGLTIEGEGSERPIFDGQDRQATWAVFDAPIGRPTRVTIRRLKITHYWSAIVFRGDKADPSKGNGGNVIEDDIFEQIGQNTNEQKPAFAVIGLTRSSDNVIRRNTFINAAGADSCGQHAVYLAHGSSGNVIEGNTFSGGCGSLIKARDGSNDNVVRGNTFNEPPNGGLLSDAYCDQRRMPEACAVQECPSYGNLIEGSVVKATRDIRPSRTVWRNEAPGCPPAAGRQRITVSR